MSKTNLRDGVSGEPISGVSGGETCTLDSANGGSGRSNDATAIRQDSAQARPPSTGESIALRFVRYGGLCDFAPEPMWNRHASDGGSPH